eukprot:1800640-Rhodomonas_salina.3
MPSTDMSFAYCICLAVFGTFYLPSYPRAMRCPGSLSASLAQRQSVGTAKSAPVCPTPASTVLLHHVRYPHSVCCLRASVHRIRLRTCYAMSGTPIAYVA